MTYQIFQVKDYKIIAPLKCGTRYLETCLGIPDTITSYMFKENLIVDKVEKIVIREPLKHLSSAIHTIILGTIQKNYLDKKVVPYKEIFIEHLNQFNSLNIGEQNGHWSSSIYKEIYFYWRRNKEYVDILQLKDLSTFLESEGVDGSDYHAEDFNFNYYKYWCTVEDLMLHIKQTYTKEWETLMTQVEQSNVWYNRLINKEIIEIKLI